jgi:undecaprenyl-diphosphatase
MLNALLKTDVALVAWVVAHRVPPLDTPLWLVSVVGRGGLVWLAIGAALAAARRLSARGLLQLALAILMAVALADRVIKPLAGRPRPFDEIAGLQVIGGRPDDSSFPSGHAANAFAGALVLARLAPWGQAVWWTFAVAIAFSRVYLGVHHPLDVAAGALIGLLCGGVALRVRWRRSSGV